MNDHRPQEGNLMREQNPAYGLLRPIMKSPEIPLFKRGTFFQVRDD